MEAGHQRKRLRSSIRRDVEAAKGPQTAGQSHDSGQEGGQSSELSCQALLELTMYLTCAFELLRHSLLARLRTP